MSFSTVSIFSVHLRIHRSCWFIICSKRQTLFINQIICTSNGNANKIILNKTKGNTECFYTTVTGIVLLLSLCTTVRIEQNNQAEISCIHFNYIQLWREINRRLVVCFFFSILTLSCSNDDVNKLVIVLRNRRNEKKNHVMMRNRTFTLNYSSAKKELNKHLQLENKSIRSVEQALEYVLMVQNEEYARRNSEPLT